MIVTIDINILEKQQGHLYNIQTSASLKSMLAIPDVMGNFLPVSGQISSPSITSI